MQNRVSLHRKSSFLYNSLPEILSVHYSVFNSVNLRIIMLIFKCVKGSKNAIRQQFFKDETTM